MELLKLEMMHQVLLQAPHQQAQLEEVEKVETELLQELQDHVFNVGVVEVVAHNIHRHNQAELVGEEEEVQVNQQLQLPQLVRLILVQVEVVTKIIIQPLEKLEVVVL